VDHDYNIELPGQASSSSLQHAIALPLLRIVVLNALAAFLLVGCASTDNIQSGAQAVQPAQLGLSGSQSDFPHTDWWTQFDDPELNRLIEQAIADNPTLQEAQARMHQAAVGAVGVAQSNLEPNLGADINSTHQLLSKNYIYPPPLAGGIYTENNALLQGNYELDFIGRNHYQLQAAIGQARAAEALSQAALVLLTTNVASRYFNLARLQSMLDVLERTLAQRQHIERLVSDRVRAGLETTLQQRQAQAEIPKILLQIEQNVQALDVERHALAALLGQGPQVTATLAPRLRPLTLPVLPANIPAELVGHRPDVVAARWQVEEALAGVKVARAEFYPNINLTAFAGYTTLFGQFLAPSSRVYGMGPAITLPIFEGGKLRANLRGQMSEADAAIDQYNATLVNAVREVADAISNWHSLQEQMEQHQVALKLVQDAYGLAQKRYGVGLGNYINVLIAENAVLQMEQADTNLKAQALMDNIVLISALGGGYVAATLPELPSTAVSVPDTASDTTQTLRL
jgi:NodT family efflux transporter outer membrane factor (OMF) lipoprotein